MSKHITKNTPLWQRRFLAPRMAGAQLAALNPQRGIIKLVDGSLHTWDVASRTLHKVTKSGAGFGGVSPDGGMVYYQEGDHLYAAPFDGSSDPRSIQPPATTPLTLSASLNGALVGFTVAGSDGYSIYAQPPESSPQLLYRARAAAFGPLLSYDADYAIVATSQRNQYGDFALMGFDLTQRASDGSLQVRIHEEQDSSLRPVAFAPVAGDARFLAATNSGGVLRPIIWDVRGGDRTDIPLDHIDGDLDPRGWSADGKRILLQQVDRAHHRLYVYDLERSTFDILKEVPNGTIVDAAYLPDGAGDGLDGAILALHQDSTTPPRVVALDGDTGAIIRVLFAFDDADDTHTAPAGYQWREVTFLSSGQTAVQGWLTTPDSEPPFPVVIHAHGGPDDVQTESYAPAAAAWVDAGFAWLSVNYRGSTSFGQQYQSAIYGMLGLREVDDLAAGAAYLVQQGIAKPEAIFVTGSHYGGFLTLLALGRRPDLWAGGIAESPVTDWAALFQDGTDTIRNYVGAIFGGAPQQISAQYRTSSPIFTADAVEAPVLIYAPADDPRLPAAHLREYGKAVRDGGGRVTLRWQKDGDSQLEHIAAALTWAQRIIKKRA